MRLTDGLIQFDTLYRDGEAAPRVMAIAVHPFVTGQPHRIGALDAALEYICSHDGVWRATSWEIVRTTCRSRRNPHLSGTAVTVCHAIGGSR